MPAIATRRPRRRGSFTSLLVPSHIAGAMSPIDAVDGSSTGT